MSEYKKVDSIDKFIESTATGESVIIDSAALNKESTDKVISENEFKNPGNVAKEEFYYKGRRIAWSDYSPCDPEDVLERGEDIFVINGDEKRKLNIIVDEHKCDYMPDKTEKDNEEIFAHGEGPFKAGAFGSNLSFHFYPNSVGTRVVVKCNCGFEEDITDYYSY